MSASDKPASGERNRRTVRVAGHNYANGLYLVTVCTAGRTPLFGRVAQKKMHLSDLGEIARREWEQTLKRPEVVPDVFVVMPDHVHLLFGVLPQPEATTDASIDRRGTARCAPTGQRVFGQAVPRTVPTIIRAYKSAVTRAINLEWGISGQTIWQRGFHDRVVRSEREAQRIRQYIVGNPARWAPLSP